MICVNCRLRNKYKIDLRSNEQQLSSSLNKASKEFRPARDLNSLTLQYRCSALLTELTSQVEAGRYVAS